MRRRQTLLSLGSLATGGSIVALTSRKSSAISLATDGLSIPNEHKNLSDPVSSVKLNLTVNYGWDASVTPSRAVMRVSVDIQNQAAQMAALELDSLSAQTSGSQDFQINLLDHPRFEAHEISPTQITQSKSVDVGVTVKLTLYNNGHKIGSTKTSDATTLEVTKTAGNATISLGGSGSVSIS